MFEWIAEVFLYLFIVVLFGLGFWKLDELVGKETREEDQGGLR